MNVVLTIDECGELLRYVRGAEFSGAARRKLAEFLEQRGLTLDEALPIAQQRWGARSKIHKMCGSPVWCSVCGKRATKVTNNGWRCREHWETVSEPLYDWASGFALPDTRDARKHRAQFSHKYCVYCGEIATCLARDAFWSCDEHKLKSKPKTPIYDRLTGERLIQEFTPPSTSPETTFS
jgi:hypothetical protein